MGKRGPKSEIDIKNINILKKKGWSNAKIGRKFGVSGQYIGRRLKTEPIIIEPVSKATEPISKKIEPISRMISNLKKELIAEFEKENATIRRALIRAKILKPLIPPCPRCNDSMKEYNGGGWDGGTYRAGCKKCGKWQRVHP